MTPANYVAGLLLARIGRLLCPAVPTVFHVVAKGRRSGVSIPRSNLDCRLRFAATDGCLAGHSGLIHVRAATTLLLVVAALCLPNLFATVQSDQTIAVGFAEHDLRLAVEAPRSCLGVAFAIRESATAPRCKILPASRSCQSGVESRPRSLLLSERFVLPPGQSERLFQQWLPKVPELLPLERISIEH